MKIKVGVYGAAGYTGGELLRLLVNHPQVSIDQIQSTSQQGRQLQSCHPDLGPYINLSFRPTLDCQELDAMFLCCPHGQAKDYVASLTCSSKLNIIDLSSDHRLNDSQGFIYGLPELNKARIQKAQRIANPGCFATAIQLALIPLAAQGILSDDIAVTAITGSTGAGQAPSATTHYSWRHSNVSCYKAFNHQHLEEIYQSINHLQKDYQGRINFVPLRGPFSRGIFCSSHFDSSLTEVEANQLYNDYYQDHPFVHIVATEPDLKSVVNSNHCFISVRKHLDKLHVISCLDNLVKGAAGQAVQNLNLINDWPESLALNLKSSVY